MACSLLFIVQLKSLPSRWPRHAKCIYGLGVFLGRSGSRTARSATQSSLEADLFVHPRPRPKEPAADLRYLASPRLAASRRPRSFSFVTSSRFPPLVRFLSSFSSPFPISFNLQGQSLCSFLLRLHSSRFHHPKSHPRLASVMLLDPVSWTR